MAFFIGVNRRLSASRRFDFCNRFHSHANQRQRIPDSRRRVRPGRRDRENLVAAGGKVVVADVNREAGEKFVAGLGDYARFIVADVTSEAQVKLAVDTAVQAFGHLHGLINCAGVAPGERVVGKNGPHKLETFSRVININLIGSFNALRLAANAMARNTPNSDGERGVIINTASIAAFEGQIGQAAYSASKGGIVAMALPIARELAKLGIRVMTIAPGIFDTPMLAGHERGNPRFARRAGAVSVAAGPARGIRAARGIHHRKSHAQCRGDPA